MTDPRSGPRPPLVAILFWLRGHLAGARNRGGQETRLRARQLEVIAVISVQAGLAAALSWWIAHHVLGNPTPVFAPSAAVGTIVAAIGQRTRRTIELLAGVGLGIVVGDFLIYLLGSGPWQVAVIVTVAIGLALGLVGHAGTVVAQVGGTAVLIATLSSSERDLELPRIADAVTGSVVGMAVVLLLLPLNPIRVVNRAAGPVFDTLTSEFQEVAAALRTRDSGRARRALDVLCGIGPDLQRLRDAVSGAEEVVRLAPARWLRRQEFERYARTIAQLNRVIEGSPELAHRAAVAIECGESVPDRLPDAVDRLADTLRHLRRAVRNGRDPVSARRRAVVVARLAGRARSAGLDNFGEAIAAQIRVSAVDVIRSTGCPSYDAVRLVRRSVRRTERRHSKGGPAVRSGAGAGHRPPAGVANRAWPTR